MFIGNNLIGVSSILWMKFMNEIIAIHYSRYRKIIQKNIQNFLLRSFMFVATYQFVVPLVMCCVFFYSSSSKTTYLLVLRFFFNSFNIQQNKKKNYYQLIRNLYSQLLKWMSNIDPRNTKSTTNNSMSFSFSIFFLISCVCIM